ncbi:MAG: 2,3-bisphosphoglycerate-independent phosphoglycerate mutase [Candidatus Magasanikbacteria bacterium]|nr:2,3-bisphosphoglycerate-independent phosphoglycerate mutase [Candidatus Magasanikbacteria bacterium]
MNINEKRKPLICVIIDGWGLLEANPGNAIALADTPVFDRIMKEYPSTTLRAYGKHVGLPPDQVGNSEAGHMNIGAGRLVEQDAVKISKSINEGTFFKNAAFHEAILHTEKTKGKIHLMGMLSDGMSAHSDPDHILALLIFLRKHKVKNVYLHLFTDGRDSPKYLADKLVERLQDSLQKGEEIATIIGRFYAMDRKKKWERTAQSYEALIANKGKRAKTAKEAIRDAYKQGESDEFIQPYVIGKSEKSRIDSNDAVIFFNLRSDRARQLTKAFLQKEYNKMNPGSIERSRRLQNFLFVAMTDFGPDLGRVLTAFPSVDIKHTLPMELADVTQAYIAETEKYAHVTYFFNGGYSGRVDGEIQAMISSPDVKSYDETPGMSSVGLTDLVLGNLENNKYDFTVLNFAAPDMIGHTGNLQAAIECCTIVDKCLGRIIEEYLKKDGTVVVTADHGNVEKMIELETGEIYTEHTSNKVPFIIVNESLKNKIKLKSGALKDVAPTLLKILGHEKPKEMTGDYLY